MSHVGNIGHHLIVAIIDHIPNGWVMFNGDMTNDPCPLRGTGTTKNPPEFTAKDAQKRLKRLVGPTSEQVTNRSRGLIR